MSAEPLVGEIVAWRAFRLAELVDAFGRRPLLASLGVRSTWQRGVVEASCRLTESHVDCLEDAACRGYLKDLHPPLHGPAPRLECSCGIYAFRSLQDHLLDEMYVTHVDLIGCVKMWGRVIRHERGYRAQYAAPSHLFAVTAAAADHADHLRGFYECEVDPLVVSSFAGLRITTQSQWFTVGAEVGRAAREAGLPNITRVPIGPAKRRVRTITRGKRGRR